MTIDQPSHSALFSRLGLSTSTPNEGVFDGTVWKASGPVIDSINPSTGLPLASVREASPQDVLRTMTATREAFKVWRKVVAPKRGEMVRQIRNAIAEALPDLGALITLEMGKIASEGRGEVQEFVDVADYAVGLSRSIGGTVIPSERNKHFISEVSNPLGVVGCITAFNFPIAVSRLNDLRAGNSYQVYGWNVSLALICGDASVWKPAQTTPLCAIATNKIIVRVLQENGYPGAISALICGGGEIGASLVDSDEVDLISFTGSEARGRLVSMEAAGKFKQSLLELGGNNVRTTNLTSDPSRLTPRRLSSCPTPTSSWLYNHARLQPSGQPDNDVRPPADCSYIPP